jgi:NAD(P)-dependent dehydrogenase (short-subunit alcohol dehydrogenase family)
VPFGRQGTSSEVAHACLSLISHEPSYINADALVVDCGPISCVARATLTTQSG